MVFNKETGQHVHVIWVKPDSPYFTIDENTQVYTIEEIVCKLANADVINQITLDNSDVFESAGSIYAKKYTVVKTTPRDEFIQRLSPNLLEKLITSYKMETKFMRRIVHLFNNWSINLALTIANNTRLPLAVIPEKYRTYEVYMIYVKKNGLNLKYVPNELKTYAMCNAAVDYSGYAILYVPTHMRMQSMKEKAVAKNPWVKYSI